MQSTGMVQLLGTTYRVLRVRRGHYQVVRIHDEAIAGSFSCGTILEVVAVGVDASLMRRLAGAAVYGGKTNWMGPHASTTRSGPFEWLRAAKVARPFAVA